MGRKRNLKIETRVTEEEKEIYHNLVKKSKLSQQDYNLKCLLQKDIYVIDGILELAFQIRKIGVNINQAVHLANQDKQINENKISDLDDKMNEIWKLLNEFVKSVKK